MMVFPPFNLSLRALRVLSRRPLFRSRRQAALAVTGCRVFYRRQVNAQGTTSCSALRRSIGQRRPKRCSSLLRNESRASGRPRLVLSLIAALETLSSAHRSSDFHRSPRQVFSHVCRSSNSEGSAPVACAAAIDRRYRHATPTIFAGPGFARCNTTPATCERHPGRKKQTGSARGVCYARAAD